MNCVKESAFLTAENGQPRQELRLNVFTRLPDPVELDTLDISPRNVLGM